VLGLLVGGTAASHIDADIADATVRYRIDRYAGPSHRPALSNATAPRSPLSGRIPGQGFRLVAQRVGEFAAPGDASFS